MKMQSNSASTMILTRIGSRTAFDPVNPDSAPFVEELLLVEEEEEEEEEEGGGRRSDEEVRRSDEEG